MKKNYLSVSWVHAFFIIASALLFPVTAHSQDLTEAQKQERCQNNKNRITELEAQSKIIEEELSKTMTEKEMEDARTQMVFIRSVKHKHMDYLNGLIWVDTFRRIIAQHNLRCLQDCVGNFKDAPNEDVMVKVCFDKCLPIIEKIIADKINKAVSLENKKPGLINKKNEIDKQLASHRNNLVALRCDEADAAQWNGTYTDGISIMTISGGPGSVSAKWTYTASDSKGTGSLTSTKIEGNKVTGTWKVQHEDDTKSGSRSGPFTITLDGKSITGQLLEDTPKWSYKTGYSAANVSSRMVKDAVWTLNLKKK